MRRIVRPALSGVVATLLISEPLLANVTGNDLQNFNATTNGLDFVTVHSSETLFPGIANFGLFANLAINTLPRYDDSIEKETELGKVRDSILAADFNFGLGLTKKLDIGLSLPFIINQEVNTQGARGEFSDTGITEVRANAKYRFTGNQDGGIAAVLSTNYNLVENNPYSGSGAGPTINFELVFDTTFDRTAFGFNLGFRKRNKGEAIQGFPIEPLGDQFIASLAVSQLITSLDTKLIAEIFTSTPVEDTATGSARSVSAIEGILGAKYDLRQDVALHFGMGSELTHGTSSPDLRLYTGINFVTGRRDHNKKIKLVRKPKPVPKKSSPAIPKPSTKVVAPPIPALPPELMSQDNYPPEPPGVGDEVFVLRDVNFAFDSANRVLPGAKGVLNALANHLRARGFEQVIIEGHTDSIGSESYNIDLGRRRAETIKSYLVDSEKLDGSRIRVLTYGEFRPIADNGNYQGRQLNRRVVFRIIFSKK